MVPVQYVLFCIIVEEDTLSLTRMHTYPVLEQSIESLLRKLERQLIGQSFSFRDPGTEFKRDIRNLPSASSWAIPLAVKFCIASLAIRN